METPPTTTTTAMEMEMGLEKDRDSGRGRGRGGGIGSDRDGEGGCGGGDRDDGEGEGDGEDGAYEPVVVDLAELRDGTTPLPLLEKAFGPSSLGILLVKGLPKEYTELRHRALSDASYLAGVGEGVLESLEVPESKYLTGWSRGKETLKSGHFDTHKGSFYVNCAEFYNNNKNITANPAPSHSSLQEDNTIHRTKNAWPPPHLLPTFKPALTSLITLIIDTAVLVARACDRYALANIEDYREGWLERVVRESGTGKGRLLHYYPVEDGGVGKDGEGENGEGDEDEDDWCATHVDHGCLTGLTAAMYVDEAAHPPIVPSSSSSNTTTTTSNIITTSPSPYNNSHSTTTTPQHLPLLPEHPPDPSSGGGLYIHPRTNTSSSSSSPSSPPQPSPKPIHIKIPADHLAFQTGEALELITQGRFRAVPHFVKTGGSTAVGKTGGLSTAVGETGEFSTASGRKKEQEGKTEEKMRIARNTLAVFTQPNLDEVVCEETGERFGGFVERVVTRHG